MLRQKTARQGWLLGRDLKNTLDRAGEVVLELRRHPEATADHIMQMVESYRRISDQVQKTRKLLATEKTRGGNYEFACGVEAGIEGKSHWSY